ncbi:hypothetical protein GX51_03627 [Blastomyces parvus]|uniref:Uncharacterized protein n=1 Tax=Blastomyces parvus TaxID=2060905 RepID=A0A2B7X6A4_9EURO|nr:hypothetical protein GX51_03627 [Blastomyces parvus]
MAVGAGDLTTQETYDSLHRPMQRQTAEAYQPQCYPEQQYLLQSQQYQPQYQPSQQYQQQLQNQQQDQLVQQQLQNLLQQHNGRQLEHNQQQQQLQLQFQHQNQSEPQQYQQQVQHHFQYQPHDQFLHQNHQQQQQQLQFQPQVEELQRWSLPHQLGPQIPQSGVFPPVANLPQEHQQELQPRDVNVYSSQPSPLHQYQEGHGTRLQKTASWPQGIGSYTLPPQSGGREKGRYTRVEHGNTGHSSIRTGESREIGQSQPPMTTSRPRSDQAQASYSNVGHPQGPNQNETVGNYPIQGVGHQVGSLRQGASRSTAIGTPTSGTKPSWVPNHTKSHSDGIYDRQVEDARGPTCPVEVMQTGRLHQIPGPEMNPQRGQPSNETLALQQHLATPGPWGSGWGATPSMQEVAPREPWEGGTVLANPNSMPQQSITHASSEIRGSQAMSTKEHDAVSNPPDPQQMSARSTSCPATPTTMAPTTSTGEDPLLMLLRAAEMILGPLIPKGMSSNAKEDGGEKLTASQKVLPLPVHFSLPYAMRTRDYPKAHTVRQLSLPDLAKPHRDIKALRLPPLVQAFRNVNECSQGSDILPKDKLQAETLDSQTIRQSDSKCRAHQDGFASAAERAQSDMSSSSNISQLFIMRKLELENCTGQTPCRRPGLEGVRYQYKAPFNIFQEILKRPELTLLVAKHLRVQELLILYRTSRDFHNVVNTRFTTVVQAQARARAPEAAKIFPPRCYAKLCIPDPALRPHPVAKRAALGETRKVPSFRWLLMVCFREMVCHEIITILAEDGVPVPDRCTSTMKKIWLLMDIPDNARRIALVQNREIFTDVDLFFATLFFVKLDMRFTDPITGSGKDGMRRLLLAQPSLSMLWRTLKRTALISKLDVMRLLVRWKYQPRQDQRGLSIFGVPAHEVGIVRYQCWGRTGNRILLQRPDELLLKESIRRGLDLQQRYTDMFLWGYINPRTMRDYPPVLRQRQMENMEGLEELLVPLEDRGKVEVGKVVSKRVRG